MPESTMMERVMKLRELCGLVMLMLACGGAMGQVMPTTQSGGASLPDDLLLRNPGRPWWLQSKPSPAPSIVGTRAPTKDEVAVVDLAKSLLASRPAKAIALLDGDKVVFLEYKAPASADSVFFGASMGKTVTSMIVGKVICSGKLTLDAKAGDVVKELHGTALGNATTRDLLRMASGAAEPLSDSSIMTKADVTEWWAGRLNLVNFVAEDRHSKAARGVFSDFKPGERFVYKSTDSVTLGAMVYRATGQPMSQWFQSSVLDPMGAAFAGNYAQDPQLNGLADSAVRMRLEDWLRFAVWVKKSSKESGCFGDYVRDAMRTQISNDGTAATRTTGKLFGGYGYQIWTENQMAPESAWASGYGGQRIGWHQKSDRMVVTFSNDESWMGDVYELGRRWMAAR
jgi:CubicO group peptidase (beta-lactamase class C family)